MIYTAYRVGEVENISNRPISFASDYYYARTYKHRRGHEGQIVKEYKIETKNPYIVKINSGNEGSGAVTAYNRLFGTNKTEDELLGVSNNSKKWLNTDKKIMKELESRGYDSLIYDIVETSNYHNISEILVPDSYRDNISQTERSEEEIKNTYSSVKGFNYLTLPSRGIGSTSTSKT